MSADELKDLSRARDRHERARDDLFTLIYEKLDQGYGPSAIARASGFTREYIAKLRDRRREESTDR